MGLHVGSWRGFEFVVPPALGLALVLSAGCDSTVGPEVLDERNFSDHREIDIRFTSGDAALEGTLYLPPTIGPHPAVASLPGSAWVLRDTWEEVGPVALATGLAVFSWDKRGNGKSTGTCCPADADTFFNLLATDGVAAVSAIRRHPEVDSANVGVVGSSLGGWVTPLAANLAPNEIAFAMNFVGGAVSSGQEGLYDELTGFASCERSALTMDEIIAQLDAAGPSGFDPTPSLEAMTQPTLWIYGGMDFSHPTVLAVRNLEAIRSAQGKDWTVVVLPNANHDLVENGSICQTEGPIAPVLEPLNAWLATLLPAQAASGQPSALRSPTQQGKTP